MNKKLKTIIKLITKNSKEPHQVSESFPGNGARKRVDTFDPDYQIVICKSFSLEDLGLISIPRRSSMVVLSSLEQVLVFRVTVILYRTRCFLAWFISIDGDRPWASASPAAVH